MDAATVAAVVGAGVTGLAALVGLVLFAVRLAVKPMFDALNIRFDQMDKRFDHVDKRFDQVDKRFDRLEKRVDSLSETVHSIDKRQTGDDVWRQEADKRLTRIETAQPFAVTAEATQALPVTRHEPAAVPSSSFAADTETAAAVEPA